MSESQVENYQFSADIKRLFDIIVQNLYSKKEVFLRELISNASDACEKHRFNSLTNNDLSDNSEICIQVRGHEDEHVLVVRDNGIGMSREDLINLLGKIAKSGTKEWLTKLSDEKQDNNLIGQFGMGFYSVFLVADKVELTTKTHNGETWVWTSCADGNYSIHSGSQDFTRGTEIKIYLKDDCHEYTKESHLKEVLERYSNFVTFPLKLWTVKTETVPILDDEKEEVQNDDDVQVEDVKESEVNDEPKTKEITTEEYNQVNSQAPVWCRAIDKVTEEEHKNFYKHISGDHEDYLAKSHFHLEGSVDMSVVLYLPRRAPMDMMGGQSKKHNRLKLYVKKIFINDNVKDLIPEWLGFVVGVVDCHQLPLNVSRELLQESRVMRVIKKQLIKKSLEMISQLSEEDMITCWESFSKHLKLGIHEETTNHNKLLPLVRFHTNKHHDKLQSLEDYISRMSENQPAYYYVTGKSLESALMSPYLKRVINDFEVILFTDAIDEYMISRIDTWKDKKFVDLAKENVDFGESEEIKKEKEEISKKYEEFGKFIRETVGNELTGVTFDKTISTDSLVTSSNFGWSANMARIMNAQALGDSRMSQFMVNQKKLVLNPERDVINKLYQGWSIEPENETIKNGVILVYESALLESGWDIKDVASYTTRVKEALFHKLETTTFQEKEVDDDVPELDTEQIKL